jgi:hypothetical protein
MKVGQVMSYIINPNSFPQYLANDIIQIHSTINLLSTFPDSYCFNVLVDNEKLEIPYRIYVDSSQRERIDELSTGQVQILSCYLTRHHDGYIRQQYLRKIILSNEPWVVPFVSQLIGEYVIEILIEISNNIEELDSKEYVKFFKENPIYFQKLKQRVISYWNCYYKHEYIDFKDYIGNKIIKHFECEF